MEDQQNSISGASEMSDSSSGVSFPTVGQPKKKSPAKAFLVIGIIVLVGILGFLIFRNSSTKIEDDKLTSPTIVEDDKTPSPTLTPSPTSKPVDKTKVKVEVQNGTGITGEAAFLQDELKKLGFATITVGNASNQDQSKATVTYSRSLAESLTSEVTTKLKEIYKEVEVKTSTTATTDIVIVTGLRKGATSKPSATITPKPSGSPTTKPTSTATSTSSPTPTP